MTVFVSTSEGLSEIHLRRPKVNAFDEAHLDALSAAVDQVAAAEVNAVVISGDGFFSAGADIRMMAAAESTTQTVAFVERMQAVYARVEALPVPTIAAIERAATGGGFELALACDIRIAGRTARVGLPEAAIGLIPGAGGTQRLTRLVGRARALDLILNARLLDGEEAAVAGLVHAAVDDDDVVPAARRYAGRLAALPRNALVAAKACIAAAGTPDGYATEIGAVRTLISSDSTRALLDDFAGSTRRPATQAAQRDRASTTPGRPA